ncbi:hypothetical protein [Geminocystis herdmanii]|uniref:hypothetical protein n=1 Tax=Geminocystis herdmanii TaxID=669359 RepID=UPI000360FEE0|nr:hypothetical protein [Geminocystis herdmanii]
MAFSIASFVCISISCYLEKDLDTFKLITTLFVLPLSFLTGITWFYGLEWGILGFIISFFMSAIFLAYIRKIVNRNR